jgi:putative thiamine transport system ATP-binding protein
MSLDIHIQSLGLAGQAPLLRDINLHIASAHIHTLMGPSGCGKSSLLLAVAGQLRPPMGYVGSVTLANQPLDHMPAHQRHIGMLFQDDLLFPHFNVFENLLFAVPKHDTTNGQALSATERSDAVLRALVQIEMEHKASNEPHQLSGGERTRVALMRALLAKPKALLLDEPFAKLDANLRQRLRDWVYGTLIASGVPTLVVTHDEQDAHSAHAITRLTQATSGGPFSC